MKRADPTILVAGYYGFGNAGDEVILAALLAELRALRPDARFVVASGAPQRTTAEHAVDAVWRDDVAALTAAVRASDLVLLGGGGLFQDYWHVPTEQVLAPRSGGLPAYVSLPVLAALCGKPCMLYAVGVGPLTTAEGGRLTRAAFELCAAATVRDEGSRATLQAIGLAGAALQRVQVTADPAFAAAPAGAEVVDRLAAQIGLQSGEPLVAVALRPWEFARRGEAWLAEAAAALSAHLGRTGGRALFLPFSSEDVRAGAEVAAALRDPALAVVVDRPPPAPVLAGLVARCRSVLAMRYHAALFGLAAGTAVAALEYDPKVGEVMRAAGCGDLALTEEDWTADAIGAALAAARPARAGFAAEMRARAAANAVAAVALLDAGGAPRTEGDALVHAVALDKALRAADLDAQVQALAGAAREAQRLGEELAARDRALLAERDEVSRLGQQRDALLAEGNGLRERCAALTSEQQRLREQRDFLAADRNNVARRLDQYEQTLAYAASRRLWAWMRAALPEGSRRRGLYRRLRGLVGRRRRRGAPAAAAAERAAAIASGPDPQAELLAFGDRVRAASASRVVAIFSATKLDESEGQRPTQLALTLAAAGVPVLFVYWRWWAHEWCAQDRVADGILQVPIDVVAARPEALTEAFADCERLALFEFPWPGFFDTVAAANAAGWITLYDVLDDWEEFHRVGQAVWYDAAFERHLLTACDAIYAINEPLANRLRSLGAGAVEVIGNGFKIGLQEVREPRPLPRGEVTVGYFGYLAGAWFDWPLIAEAARARPSWTFYLIGYGGSPEAVELPDNVRLLGKQPQRDLAAFAANWDVAIIPFKADRLAVGADPIKTYEYLAMGLPVVVTGVHAPLGGEELVIRTDGLDEFLAALAHAATQRSVRTAERLAFADSSSWERRLAALLASVDAGAQKIVHKRALFAAP
jgi:polysaccharide pyruvyl transferase CsaB